MSDGQLFKPEKDYTNEVDKQIPEAQELARVFHGISNFKYCLADLLTNRAMFKAP